MRALQLCFWLFALLLTRESSLLAEEKVEAYYAGSFSSSASEKLPRAWNTLKFSTIFSKTQYKLIDKNSTRVLQAKSSASASGLFRKIKLNPERYPVLSWSWMATSKLLKADVRRKDTDDCQARLYVSFGRNPKKPVGALNYVWTGSNNIGATIRSPYSALSQVIVLRNNSTPLHKWHHERRNIYKDYIDAFGKKPPVVSQISVMTDTDNTKGRTISYYGDIVFGSEDKN